MFCFVGCCQPECTNTKPMPAEEVMPVIQSNLDYMEEDKPLIPGVTVRAATADKLVHICIESFCKYKILSI